MAYLGTKPANQVIDSTLIADGTVTPADLSTGAPNWNTSGSVGIGTASPTSKLHVNSTTTTVANFASTGSSSFIGLSNSGSSAFVGSDSSGNLVVQTPGSGYATKLNVDSAGRVTMPYQPAFQANVSSSATTITAGNNIVFENSFVNVGSHYNSSNGRFTAPVAGNYFFSFSVLKGNTSGLEVRFLKNGSDYHDSMWAKDNSSASNMTISCSTVIALAVNDYVTVNVYSGTAYGDYSNFCGHLIG